MSKYKSGWMDFEEASYLSDLFQQIVTDCRVREFLSFLPLHLFVVLDPLSKSFLINYCHFSPSKLLVLRVLVCLWQVALGHKYKFTVMLNSVRMSLMKNSPLTLENSLDVSNVLVFEV